MAIRRHFVLLDECIAAHGGVRPVEQGEGDSVVGAFSRASDAIAAALDAQRAFAAEPWPEGGVLRVRMAIHTGEAQLRDSGNYFGQAVIRCARLRAVGHGGQILVSDATAGLVADRLPAGVELVELGVHRLKDLGRPERVRQLTGPDLPAGFPPLRSLDAFRHNLPVQLTPLVGRGDATAEVARLVAEQRLVTLTGSGRRRQNPTRFGGRGRVDGALRRRGVAGRAGRRGRPERRWRRRRWPCWEPTRRPG